VQYQRQYNKETKRGEEDKYFPSENLVSTWNGILETLNADEEENDTKKLEQAPRGLNTGSFYTDSHPVNLFSSFYCVLGEKYNITPDAHKGKF
jgi:hypothetical protein